MKEWLSRWAQRQGGASKRGASAERIFVRRVCGELRPGAMPTGLKFHKALLLAAQGFRPEEVMNYGLDLRGNPKHYIGELDRLRLQIRTSAPADVLLHDKLLFHTALPGVEDLVCKLIGIMVGGCYLEIERNGKVTAEGNAALVEHVRERNLVVKPIRGSEKRDVVVLQCGENRELLANGNVIQTGELDKLLNGHQWSIVTEYAKHGRYAEHIAPGLSHFIRVLTIRSQRGEPEVIGASHQFSTRASQSVPGQEDGAIRAPVESLDGELGWGVFATANGRLGEVNKHPDTGQTITGIRVPNWPVALENLREAHSQIPAVPSVCWDLIMTDAGPKVIEAERALSPRVFQRHQPLFTNRTFYEFAARYGVEPGGLGRKRTL